MQLRVIYMAVNWSYVKIIGLLLRKYYAIGCDLDALAWSLRLRGGGGGGGGGGG